jgi:hypothetical protein
MAPSLHMFKPGFNPLFFGTELVLSIIIILLCLIIYQKTKDMYKLTGHKGIAFFRNTFLFLGLAYFFKYVIRIRFITTLFDKGTAHIFLMPLSFLTSSLLSTIAISYLFLSLTWKKTNSKHAKWIFIPIAFLVAFISMITREPMFIILLQSILLIATVIFSLKLTKKSKKLSKLFVIYNLLFIFWIIDLLSLSPRKFLPPYFNLFVQIASFVIFIIIFVKVNKWLK